LNEAEKYIAAKLSERKSAGLYRALKPENSLIDFCSNDYLGFARSLELKEKIDRVKAIIGQLNLYRRSGTADSKIS